MNWQYAFFVFIFAVYPLAMTNGYVNLAETKLVCLLLIAIVFGMLLVFRKKKKQRTLEKYEVAVIVFSITETLTWLSTNNMIESAMGTFSNHMGYLASLICMVLLVCGGEIECERTPVFRVIAGTISIEGVFSLAQFLGWNVFWLVHSSGDQAMQFLSTLGNTGLYGVYVVMLYPLMICYYMENSNVNKSMDKSLSLIALFFSYVGVLISNSDTAIVGLGAVTLLSFILFRRERYALLSAYVMAPFAQIVLLLAHNIGVENMRPFHPFPRRFVSAAMIGIELCILVIGKLWLRMNQKGKYVHGLKFAALTTETLSFLLIFWILWRKDVISHLLVWNDDWGNGRGFVWSRTVQLFTHMNGKQWLFGVGQGNYYPFLYRFFGKELMERDYVFTDAHSVYLQFAVEHGILGVFSFSLLVIVIVGLTVSYWKKAERINQNWVISLLLSIGIYACMKAVWITEPITLGMHVVIVGMYCQTCKGALGEKSR